MPTGFKLKPVDALMDTLMMVLLLFAILASINVKLALVMRNVKLVRLVEFNRLSVDVLLRNLMMDLNVWLVILNASNVKKILLNVPFV